MPALIARTEPSAMTKLITWLLAWKLPKPREQALARQLSQDSEVTNRLIQQALYFLGVGPRKHAFDQKLVDGRN